MNTGRVEKGRNDGSDRKSLDNLMNKLKELNKREKREGPSPSQKNVSSKRSADTSTKSQQRKRHKAENSPKITSWLTKDNKRKPLEVSVCKHEKKTKFERKSSFEKYGVVIPSFEKIKEDQKKYDEHKEMVKKFDTFDDKLLEKELTTDLLNEVEEFKGELLDCRHLSLSELSDAFSNHLKTLNDIMNGKAYSERHQRFHKFDVTYNYTSKDLRCSSSLVVFTQEQKEHMLDLMRVEMDPEDKKTSYFFKVLLPELCVLIFMDTHGMSKQEANKYLDERPLDI